MIGLLSERQRVIIYMYYYDGLTINEIARKLNISSGTVKWHLSDAKSSLKEEMVMVRKDNLSVNPIKFVSMGSSGSPGESGDTSNMFDTRLKQNIAWSCCHKAKKIEEVAKYLCDNFYKEVLDKFDLSEDNWGFECPDNDKNFMKYNLVMLIHKNMITHFGEGWDKFAVRRPDGGHFISYASVTDDCNHPSKKVDDSTDNRMHWFCGYMFRQAYVEDVLKMQVLQGDCEYCDRTGGWIDNKNFHWEYLYRYIENGKDKTKIDPEEYKVICEKGYVADGQVQVMVYKATSENLEEAMDIQIRKMVEIPQEIADYGQEMDEKLFLINKKRYPERLAGMVRFHCNILGDGTLIPFIIEELLDQGILKPLTERQKKSVFTIVSYVDEGVEQVK